MANIAFDFLADSFLFDDRYIEEIISEVRNDTELNVSIETLDNLPDEQLLKQLAMYLDKVVISDPIFEISLDADNPQMDMKELWNLPQETAIDREKLADAAKYMKWSAP